MRSRASRAVVRYLQVFFFDEPLSDLDAKLRVQLRTQIKSLHQRLRTTPNYVTRDHSEALTMADKIVLTHDSVIEHMGGRSSVMTVPPISSWLFSSDRRHEIFNGRVVGGQFLTDAGDTLPPGEISTDADSRPTVYDIRPKYF